MTALNQSGAMRHRAARTRALLVEMFPLCFAGKGQPKRPLAIGIFDQVVAALPEIGFGRLREALDDYTDGPTYLKSVVAGAERIGLDGKPCGIVSEGQATYAAGRARRFVPDAPPKEF